MPILGNYQLQLFYVIDFPTSFSLYFIPLLFAQLRMQKMRLLVYMTEVPELNLVQNPCLVFRFRICTQTFELGISQGAENLWTQERIL
jgi:hypothetical protein